MRNGASQLQRSTGLLVSGHCCPQDEILLPDARERSTDYDWREYCANELRTAKEKICVNIPDRHASFANVNGVRVMNWLSIVQRVLEFRSLLCI